MQTFYPIFGNTIVAPIEERRAADPFPSMQLLAAANGNFAAELNKWFDDRVGFRDLLIRAKNQADYALFNTSKKVYIGADGWLFYRHPIDSIANVNAAGLSALEASYLALARQLNERGIHLIVIGYPQKVAIYPEMAPPDMPVRPGAATMNNSEVFFPPIRADVHRRRRDNKRPQNHLGGIALCQGRHTRHPLCPARGRQGDRRAHRA